MGKKRAEPPAKTPAQIEACVEKNFKTTQQLARRYAVANHLDQDECESAAMTALLDVAGREIKLEEFMAFLTTAVKHAIIREFTRTGSRDHAFHSGPLMADLPSDTRLALA